LVKVTQSRRTT